MKPGVYIYNTLAKDKLSAVRGIGRYIQVFRENIGANLVTNINKLPKNSFVIYPFINLTSFPPIYIANNNINIGVIHDVIVIKYPKAFKLGLKGKFYVKLYKHYILGLFDKFITDSYASKKDIINLLGINSKKIHVIYPSIAKTLATKPKKPNIDIPKTFVLYVGDVTWNKNITALAKACIKAGVHCVLVGKAFAQKPTNHPWHREYKEFNKIIKNNSLFIKTGFCPDNELIWLYENAAANILISRDEGYGYSFIEASAHKTPSILSNINVFHETAGNSALFANHTSISDIAEKIILLTTNKNLRNKLGIKAYKHIQIYSDINFSKNIKKLLQS